MRTSLRDILLHFDDLPDSARVPGAIVDALLSMSRAKRWRLIRDGQLPRPEKIGGRPSFAVGDIRKVLRGGEGQV